MSWPLVHINVFIAVSECVMDLSAHEIGAPFPAPSILRFLSPEHGDRVTASATHPWRLSFRSAYPASLRFDTSGQTIIAPRQVEDLFREPVRRLLQCAGEQLREFPKGPLRLWLVVSRAIGHCPTVEGAIVHFAFVLAAPRRERAVEILDCLLWHGAVLRRMTEVKPGLDPR